MNVAQVVDAAQGASASAATTTALTVLLSVLLLIVLYVWIALALSALFRKSGEEGWKGWVPVLNEIVVLQLGGLSGWLYLLVLIPGLGTLIVWVLRTVAAHRINLAFGYGAGMTVVAALLFPVWASVLGFGSARWVGQTPRAAAREAAIPGPIVGRVGSPASGVIPTILPTPFGASRGAHESAAFVPLRAEDSALPEFVPEPWGFAPPLTRASLRSQSDAADDDDVDDAAADNAAPDDAAPDDAGSDDVFARSFDRWPSVASTATDGSRPSDDSVSGSAVTGSAVSSVPRPRVAASEIPPAERDDLFAPFAPIAPFAPFAPAVSPAPTADGSAREPFAPPADPAAGAVGNAAGETPRVRRAPAPAPPEAFMPPLVTRAPAVSAAADRETWGPRRSETPLSDDGYDETSGEVSAVAGAPRGGDPRSALASVSAQHTKPELPEEEGFDETVITRRRRLPWVLVPPVGVPIDILADVVILGRRPEIDPGFPKAQLIAIADDTRTVSKNHARLELRGDSWFVTDLGSTNGVTLVTLMGTEIDAEPGVELAAGERFFLGDAEVRLQRNEP